MSAGLKKLVLTLTMLSLFLGLIQENVIMVSSDADARKIDLFTQKVPFNGKGINEPSDAFQPQELVTLYANVTYNEAPVENKLVAFQVNNPVNEFWNITIVGVNSTNNMGLAQFSFRIPWPSENPEKVVFGEWFAVATVDLSGEVVMDTLIFKVGWIVEITKVEILNEDLEPQTKFFLDEVIVFNLTVNNIAFITKFGIIMVDVQDAADNPIIHVGMDNVAFQPGVNRLLITSRIPKTSAIGEATVSATAHTAMPEAGGVPYCPPVSTTFVIFIPPVRQYYLTIRTEPLNVAPIFGEGWYNEGANVNLNAPKEVLYVNIGVRYLFRYWDVDGISHELGANAITVVMDANHTATAHYVLQYYLTVRTDPSGITTISGEGWYDARTNVTLTAPNVAGYNFRYWDINGVTQSLGINTITVLVDSPKTATAHYVKAEAPGAAWFISEWFYWLLLLLLLLLIIVLLILYYRRKRRRSAGEFHSGWTAWYYRYDLRKAGKIR